jgi:hypothetical protein
MPDINTLFPSKYLQAADAENPLNLTILKITQEKMKQRDGTDIDKPVVFFREVPKGMVLNRTNANFLINLYGKDYAQWVGKSVTLGIENITAFGETQAALRFRDEEPKFNHAQLLDRYSKLYERARRAGVEDLDTYIIPADASDATIIEMGKDLKPQVEAAEAF